MVARERERERGREEREREIGDKKGEGEKFFLRDRQPTEEGEDVNNNLASKQVGQISASSLSLSTHTHVGRQMSRNAFRGDKEAFAYDATARQVLSSESLPMLLSLAFALVVGDRYAFVGG